MFKGGVDGGVGEEEGGSVLQTCLLTFKGRCLELKNLGQSISHTSSDLLEIWPGFH